MNQQWVEPQGFLSALLHDTPYNFKKVGNGYTVFFDGNKAFVIGQIFSFEQNTEIPFATIYCANKNEGTYADEHGNFFIRLTGSRNDTVEISCIGYKTKRMSLLNFRQSSTKIFLESEAILPELIIDETGHSQQTISPLNRSFSRHIPTHVLYHEGSILGQADALQYIKRMSSVNPASDGISGLRIQGGSHDQNLVLMDHVPIYHHSHGLDLHSVFNAAIIEHANIYDGYFPANFQGRTSSVISIETKNGDLNEFHGRLDASPFGAGLKIEGPIIKNRLAFVLSGRYADLEQIRNKIAPNRISGIPDKRTLGLNYTDANMKLLYTPSLRSKLIIGGFHSRDNFDDLNEYRILDYYENIDVTFDEILDWRNKTAFIKYVQEISPSVEISVQPYFSNFQYDSRHNTLETYFDSSYLSSTDFRSQIQETGFKSQLSLSKRTFFPQKVGFQYARVNYTPGILRFNDQQFARVGYDEIKDQISGGEYDEFDETSQETSIFVEKEVHILDRSRIHIGLTGVRYTHRDFQHYSVQPRVGIRHIWNKSLSSQFSGALMSQPRHVLSPANNGLPNDLWVPATQEFKPQRSWQVKGNLSWFIKQKHHITFGLYYKYQDRIIKFPEGAISTDEDSQNIEASAWEFDAESGERKSYGATFEFHFKLPKCEIQSAYTFSRSQEAFSRILDGAWYDNFYHRDHQLTTSINIRPLKYLSITPAVTYGSPNTLTFIPATYSIFYSTDQETFDYIISPDPLTLELPVFFRGDISVNYILPGKKFIHRLKGSVFNLLNRENFSHYSYIDVGYVDPKEFNLFIQYGPQRIYSLNYSISF